MSEGAGSDGKDKPGATVPKPPRLPSVRRPTTNPIDRSNGVPTRASTGSDASKSTRILISKVDGMPMVAIPPRGEADESRRIQLPPRPATIDEPGSRGRGVRTRKPTLPPPRPATAPPRTRTASIPVVGSRLSGTGSQPAIAPDAATTPGSAAAEIEPSGANLAVASTAPSPGAAAAAGDGWGLPDPDVPAAPPSAAPPSAALPSASLRPSSDDAPPPSDDEPSPTTGAVRDSFVLAEQLVATVSTLTTTGTDQTPLPLVEERNPDAIALVPDHPKRGGALAGLATRRNLAIAAGSIAVVIVLLVVATGGKGAHPAAAPTQAAAATQPPPSESPKEAPVAAPAPAPAPPPEPDSAPAEPSAAAEAPPPTDEAPPPTDEAPPPAEPTVKRAPHAPDKQGPRPPPRVQTLGGKQVVVEYDSQARGNAAPAAPKADQSAVRRARLSYAAGNQRLFAGDADSAIRYYKAALKYYPGYVAGYRGLGLAYGQKHDNAKALQAFRQYLHAAQGAKDAVIIRKRMRMLGAR